MAVGVVFMTVGLLALLTQVGLVDLGGLGRWWPLLLIGVGLVKVIQPPDDRQRGLGIVLLALGGFYEVVNVLAWRTAWPVLMILAGAFLVWRGVFASPRAVGRCGDFARIDTPHVSLVSVFGRIRRIVVAPPDFEGGDVTAVLGGIELDFREARIGSSPVRLDVVAMLGGIDIKIPRDWIVEGGVSPILGGFENKSRAPLDAAAAPRLVLRGYAVMGGVNVDN
jgi:hypothetical protein